MTENEWMALGVITVSVAVGLHLGVMIGWWMRGIEPDAEKPVTTECHKCHRQVDGGVWIDATHHVCMACFSPEEIFERTKDVN